MKEYKVETKTIEDQRDVIELFTHLGYSRLFDEKKEFLLKYVCVNNCGELLITNIDDGEEELTIQQLRDLVVLKRNDVSDATHTDSNKYDWFVASDQKHYRFQGETWVHQPYVDCIDLTPIQKPQDETEYLMQGKNGERLVESVGKLKGMKFDSEKPRHSLLPKGAVNSVIAVLEFGAKKYDVDNWKKVDNAKERYYNAAMRHIDLWWNGEKHDSETNIHHLAHAATNLFFLMWFDNK